ncbi:MAG: hypothetical protein K6E51_05590 [Treponema sp.]|nr:hypothetical protein [Treponema sp.]
MLVLHTIQKYMLLCLTVLVCLISGCTLLDSPDERGSITFYMSGDMAHRIASGNGARAALTPEEMEGLYFDIDIKGDFEASETIPVTEGAVATFSDIPVGSEIYAEALAYRIEDSNKVKLYKGKSKKVTIENGENLLEILMQWAYFGTKMPGESLALYDIVFNDGSAVAYSDTLTLTDEQKAAAMAVIFYAGSGSPNVGSQTLGVGVTNTYAYYNVASPNNTSQSHLRWGPNSVSLNVPSMEVGISTSSDSQIEGRLASKSTFTATGTGELSGSNAWSAFCAVNTTATANLSTKYPAWNWALTYGNHQGLDGEYAEGWYMPSVAEFAALHRNKVKVNKALGLIGGTKFPEGIQGILNQNVGKYVYEDPDDEANKILAIYWTASIGQEFGSPVIWSVSCDYVGWCSPNSPNGECMVCAIREF